MATTVAPEDVEQLWIEFKKDLMTASRNFENPEELIAPQDPCRLPVNKGFPARVIHLAEEEVPEGGRVRLKDQSVRTIGEDMGFTGGP